MSHMPSHVGGRGKKVKGRLAKDTGGEGWMGKRYEMEAEEVEAMSCETHLCCVRPIDANKIGSFNDLGSLLLAFTASFK